MKIKLLAIPFLMGCCALVTQAQTGTKNYNVTAFGAHGDGNAIDTKSINKAIDAAAAHGGGTVYFPAGSYLCGSIHLQSNISLYIDQGATIIAAPVTEQAGYDDPETPATDNAYQDFGHRHWHNSLIWGENLHNISILGPGTIWGKDLARSNKGDDDKRPNKSISLRNCRNVIIRDVSIRHGGWFGILATGVDNFTIDNVKMDTNRDGMDVDCCRNVRISNCSVNSPYDDGICLKSSYGLGVARATENVTITNCQVSGYDEGSFLDGTFTRNVKYGASGPTGRIKFGTESNGGFKNITISNCVFDYCRGLALEAVDGALLEDVTITNITMRDIGNAPIFVRLGKRMRGPENTPPSECRRIIISNVVCYNTNPKHSVIITGVAGHDIEDLKLSNIRIYAGGGGTKEQAQRVVPALEEAYPEPDQFGAMPTYGFFVRNVKDFKMNDVEISYIKEDQRPPFILDHVSGADFQHIRAQKAPGTPTFILNNVTGFNIYNSTNIANTNLLNVVNKEIQ